MDYCASSIGGWKKAALSGRKIRDNRCVSSKLHCSAYQTRPYGFDLREWVPSQNMNKMYSGIHGAS